MEYESDWVKGRDNMLWTRDLGQTNRQTDRLKDRQTDHYRVPQGRALIIGYLNIATKELGIHTPVPKRKFL